MSVPASITIREATLADLPSIVRMLADDKLGRTREDFTDPLPACYEDAFREIDVSAANLLLVAELESQVVAVLQLTLIPYLTHQGGRRALIEGVRVDAEHRAQGIGRLLISEAIRRAREAGCHMIQLTTDKARPEALQFYESMGFVASHEGLKLTLQQ